MGRKPADVKLMTPPPEAAGKPIPPKHLKGEALRFWKLQVPLLIDMGTVGEADSAELAMLCEWWARYRVCADALDAEPPSKLTKDLMQQAVQAQVQFNYLATKFGMTPEARMKIAKGGPRQAKQVMSRAR